MAFHKTQGDERLRRALMQRARTAKKDFEVGDPVHFWNQPKDRRRAHWAGPAVVVGKQGSSCWISRNGRCRLTAPEHLRSTGPEEIGEYLTMKGVKGEVNKLLSMDPDDPETWEQPEGGDEDDAQYSPSEIDDIDPLGNIQLDADEEGDTAMPMEEEVLFPTEPPSRRLKRKTRPENVDAQADEVMMLKRALTQRGQAKRQEKELKWSEIPPEARELFRDAERVQWEEHLSYDALEPLDENTSPA